MDEQGGIAMENSTSLMMFGIAFLAIFGVLMGITGAGSASISMADIRNVLIVGTAAAVITAVIGSVAAGITALGSGSAEAGHFVWKGAVFGFFIVIMIWIGDKMINLLPSEMPSIISVLFIAPPMGALLWGFIETFMRSGG